MRRVAYVAGLFCQLSFGGLMLGLYLDFVKNYPLISSAVQIAILGTAGELLAARIRLGRWYFFGPGPWIFIAKMIVWAFLGITFKYAFVGFFGFVAAIVQNGFWVKVAETNLIARAFSVSIFANIIFGPVFMTFHRWTDNVMEGKEMNWKSLQKAWWTLIWFWIPAHTLTFSIPHHLQIGLLAVWSIILGAMLGFFARGKS
jgi:hypothetical protein